MTDHTATCRKCGAPFKPSRTGFTVNCPAHRGRAPRTTTRTATTCRCGKTVTHVNRVPVTNPWGPGVVTCPRECA
jgi:hypothetical protein